MKIDLQKGFRVNQQAGCVTYVEHATEKSLWCGPVITSDTHHRAGEISTPLICAACADFLEAEEPTIATVRRVDKAAERAEAAGRGLEDEQRQAAKLRGRARELGLREDHIRRLEVAPAPRKAPAMRQGSLFGGKS